jgi:uncharacterized protein
VRHPDVVAYARSLDLPAAEKAEIDTHLKECGECRDFVLFIRKVNATLRQEATNNKEIRQEAANDAKADPSLGKVAEPRQAEYRRLAEQHRQCSQRLDALLQKRNLSGDEQLEEVRLKKQKLRLKGQMEHLELRAACPSITEIPEPLREEFRRLAREHGLCSNRLDELDQKRFMTEDDRIEEVRLKKQQLLLKTQLDELEHEAAHHKNKRA